MSIVRKLKNKDIEDFVEIAANANCGLESLEAISKRYRQFFSLVLNEFQGEDLFGLYRNEKLLGGMRLIDFNMKLLSRRMKVGGIAHVAVDLLHKKEKVAKELIEFACNYFREKGMRLAALYPFRTDFYKNMGFGYGVELKQYSIDPKYFPKGLSKKHIVFLSSKDRNDIVNCYNRFLEKNNGMMEKTNPCLRKLFYENRRIIGYKKDNRLLGYINFSSKSKDPLKNNLVNLVIHELIYENHEVLLELCTFLNSQGDQFNRIVINTPDEHFHYLVNNPAGGDYDAFNPSKQEFCVSTVGAMYRVLDVRGLFNTLSNHNFNNQSCRLKLTVIDDFLKYKDESIVVDFKDGRAVIYHDKGYEVEIKLKICDFSSLVMGAISLKTLVEYGLCEISDAGYMDVVNKIFLTDKKPMCITYF